MQFVDLSTTDANNAEHIVQEMYQQGYHPQVIESAGTDLRRQLHPGGRRRSRPPTGSGSPRVRLSTWAATPRRVPAVNTFLEWVQKVHPGFTPDLYTLYGWASAQLLVQAIKVSRIDSDLVEPCSRRLKQITNFDASGLMAPANPAGKARLRATSWPGS